MDRRVGLVAVVLLVACGSSEPRIEQSSAEARVCAKGPTVEGIDVSKWQSGVNFAQIAESGRQFAFVRVSDGARYRDPKFASYYAGAKSAGMFRGVYQYFRASQDAEEQANLLSDAVGKLGPGDLPAVLDIEELDGQAAATVVPKLKTWLARVEERTGKVPIVYTARYFWDDQLGAPAGFERYPLWVANYGASCPSVPSSWGEWAFWQYSGEGAIKGVSGPVDLNLFQGTVDDLARLAGGRHVGGGVVTTAPATDAGVDTLEAGRQGTPNTSEADAGSPAAAGIEGFDVGDTVRVATERLNLRQGPGTDNRILDTLTCGQSLVVLAQPEGGWVRVRDGEHEGYCSIDYLVAKASFDGRTCPASTQAPDAGAREGGIDAGGQPDAGDASGDAAGPTQAVPTTPEDLFPEDGTLLTHRYATLRWGASMLAEYYVLKVFWDDDVLASESEEFATEATWQLPSPNMMFYWSVSACNANGCSLYTAPRSISGTSWK